MAKKKPVAPFPHAPAEILALANADLARSGLTLEDAAALGCDVVDAERTRALRHPHDRPSIVFPYWDPFENAFIDVAEFHRVRLLGTAGGFAAQTKEQKYSQPPNTLNSIYIPRCVGGEPFDWLGYLASADNPLYITEGEKKAACACKMGFPTLGLGGVDVFRAQKRGARELPLLSKIDLRGRVVSVVFDTDHEEGLKPEVMRAAKRLLDHLLLKGARPYLVVLPSGSDGAKMGLDDYLVEHGAAKFHDEILMQCAYPHADAIELCETSARYRYIEEVDRFVGDDARVLFSSAQLDRVLGLRQVSMPRLAQVKRQGGSIDVKYVPKPVPLSDALLVWGATESFRSMVYRPGAPREVLDEAGRPHLNLWEGWRCEYSGTDRLPSEALREKFMVEWDWALDNVFGDDAVARAYVEHWLYYPMQNPGAKLNTFALITSRAEGIGKSFIGHMVAKHVYGLVKPGPRHAWQLAEGDLHGQFNPFLHATSFVEGDDIAGGGDKKHVYKRIQSFVTSDTVQINTKGTPQFMLSNCANIWLTSNEAAPFFLTGQDRRAFIHTPSRAKKNPERYRALQALFDEGIGGPTLLWHARERYNSAGFSPVHEAPLTAGKKEVMLNSQSSMRDWIACLVADVDNLTRPVATAREIFALMDREEPQLAERKSVDSIGHALRDAGAVRWGEGVQLIIRYGESTRRERAWLLDTAKMSEWGAKDKVEHVLGTVPFGRREGNVVPLARAGGKY